jgi:hypothetical protein
MSFKHHYDVALGIRITPINMMLHPSFEQHLPNFMILAT